MAVSAVRDVADTYFEAWQAGDFERLRSILADDATFDGPDVLTWFDLHTATAGPLPTVNWRHVENGKITRIRVTFDPRPLTSGQ